MSTLVRAARLFARPVLLAMPARHRKRYARKLAESLSRRAPDRSEPYPTDGGVIYLNVAESHMMAMRALGLYELEKRRFLKSILRPGAVFVDAGANKGDFSLLAAAATEDKGRVIAVEPEPRNLSDLRRTLALNRYSNVEIVEAALSDKDSSATLYLGDKSGFHTLKPGQPERRAGELRVRTRRLDSVAVELGVERIDALKIDVEGGEVELLRGARSALASNPGIVLLIDLHPHLGADLDALEAILTDWGFRFFAMDSPRRQLEHLPRRPTDVIARRTPAD